MISIILALSFFPLPHLLPPEFEAGIKTEVKPPASPVASATPIASHFNNAPAMSAALQASGQSEQTFKPKTPEPPPTPPTSIPAESQEYATTIEQEVFLRTNEERSRVNTAALLWDAELARLSRSHSADMIAKKYFSHIDPDGCGSSCRANKADYLWWAIGENIYMTSGYNLTAPAEAEMVIEGWMNSLGHRGNILGEQYTHSGIGVMVHGESVYVTAMYSKPR